MTGTTWDDLGIDTEGHRSGQHKVKCPNCKDNRKPQNRHQKPLSVNLDDGVYLCHNCGWSGALKRENWQQAIASTKRYAIPDAQPDATIKPRGKAWLQSRGIDPDMAADEGIYSDDKDTALAYPFIRDGQVVHIKYRRFPKEGFWSTKDTERIMYGLDDCAGSDTVLICEGEMDRLAFLMAGFIPTMSVSDGAPAPGTNIGAKLDCLASAGAILDNARKVIIATDNDANGQYLADELVRRIGPEKCWRVAFPEGCKDANDVLLQPDGANLLAQLVDQARPEPSEGIFTGHDLQDALVRLHRTGKPLSYDFGYPVFDTFYRVLPGYMTVVTGHAGHGKSTAFDQLLIRLWERHNFRIAIFSPEQQPLEWHQSVLVSLASGLPFFDGPRPRITESELIEWNEKLSRNFYYVLPEDPTINSILEKARTVIFRYGLDGLVIDPWNELEHSRPSHMSETEYVSVALRTLRNFARTHQIHLWLIAHPTKMQLSDDGEERVPGLGNISGSNNFRNKADFGISVWRDVTAPDNPVDIHITKTRRRETVRLGAVRFQFNPVNNRLIEIGERRP